MVSESLGFPESNSIVECVFAHAASQADKLCLADCNQRLSYGETRECVAACARAIAGCGAMPGDNVVIECDQSVGFVVAVLAAQLAGCRSVPLEKNMAPARRGEIAREVDAALYVGAATLDELATAGEHVATPGELARIPRLAVDISRWKDGTFDATAWTDGDTFPVFDADAEILFSTGTTGKSKGIVMTHGANLALAENIVCGVRMGPDNVEIVPMPLSHSHGLRTVYANLANGSSVVIADGVVALKRMLNLMDEHRVTAMDLSPSMLSIIFKLSGDRLGEYAEVIDYVQLGSAPLPEQDKNRLAKLLPHSRLYNFYGSTEAGRSCVLDFSEAAGKSDCIGKPTVNARFAIVDERRRPLASSRERLGFLASSGGGVMREYFNAPDLTRAAMEDGVVYTSDLGYIDDDGFIYMLGREDDVINFGGTKIAPEEIETVVREHAVVEDCACVPVPDALTGQAPVLCLVPKADAQFDENLFRKFLATALDADKQPKRVVLVAEIPRTFNGKIKRRELVDLL